MSYCKSKKKLFVQCDQRYFFLFLATGDNQQQRYWDIQLDQDLLETICSIYPEWFKDCNMNLGPENNNNSSTDIKSSKQEESHQKSIDKNKECMLKSKFIQLFLESIRLLD